MKIIFPFILFSCLIFSPLLGQTREEKKEEKLKKGAEDFEKIKALIDGKVYEFEAYWTTSSQGGRFNLISRANLLQIRNDSVDVRLAYFGVQHAGSTAMNRDGGIVYKGLMDDYQTKINQKKSTITIEFNTKNNPEYYQFIMTVYKSGSTVISVTSNVRSGSNYDGITRAIKE